ncbi:MAG: hypothetical protein O2800_01775 [Planctomycetota bacterium]|nr:hypothetical protein [Planctomycetota bacterium]
MFTLSPKLLRGRLFNVVAASLITLYLLQEATRSISTTREVIVLAQFLPSSERMMVTPVDPFPVTLQLIGTASELRRFESTLPPLVELIAGSGGVPGTEGSWPIADRLPDFFEAKFDLARVTINSARGVPTSTTLVVTDLVERTVDIVLNCDESVKGASIEGSSKATVFVPPDLAQAKLELTVRLTAMDRPPGAYRDEVQPVAMDLPEARRRELGGIRPVSVDYTVIAATSEIELPRVAVQIAALPESLSKFIVTFPPEGQFIQRVVVTGPTEAIELLSSNTFKPIAIVHLTHEELVNRVPMAQVDLWMLPPGVRVIGTNGSANIQPAVAIQISPAPTTASTPIAPSSP